MTYQEVLRHSKLTSQVKDESLDEKQVFQIYYDFFFRDSWKYAGLSYLGSQSWEKLGIRLESVLNMRQTAFLPSLQLVSRLKMPILMKLFSNPLRRKKSCLLSSAAFRTELTEKAEEGSYSTLF